VSLTLPVQKKKRKEKRREEKKRKEKRREDVPTFSYSFYFRQSPSKNIYSII